MKIIFSHLHVPAFNIAAEEYLFSYTDEAFLLLYVNTSSVIIGSNQAVHNEANVGFCQDNNIQIIRRISGGGAVFHDEGNLNYCFIGNKHPNRLPVNADFLNPIIDILHAMHVPAKMGKRKDLWLPDGHKISGTASHISRNRTMYHGTLLYDSDLEQLQHALSPQKKNRTIKATPSVPSAVKNIRTFLSKNNFASPLADDFFGDFSMRILHYFNRNDFSRFSDEEIATIEKICNEKYSRKNWNFRM